MNQKLIAIIDDDNDFRTLCGEALRMRGHEFVAYARASEALEAFRSPSGPAPKLILVDLMMPGMSGSAFIIAVRALARMKGAKIYVASGKDSVCADATDAGADGFLKKPFDLDELYHLVDKALST